MKLTLLALSLSLVASLALQAEEKSAPDTKGFSDLKLADLVTEGNWVEQEDGVIYLEPREGEKGWTRYGSYLWLKEDYADFSFDFEYKHEKGGNSGFYFRIADRKDPVASGVEIQILDSFGVEKELGHHDLGGIIRTQGPKCNAAIAPGEWNRMQVTLKGTHLTCHINGKLVQDIDLGETKPAGKDLAEKGAISIQDHGLKYWVRNLKVKAL